MELACVAVKQVAEVAQWRNRTVQTETGKEEAGSRGGGAVLATGSLEFSSAVASNPNLRKPHRWFWKLLCTSIKLEKTIFLFPVPPRPTSAPYDSLADRMGILPKALNGGWGAALCQPATGK